MQALPGLCQTLLRCIGVVGLTIFAIPICLESDPEGSVPFIEGLESRFIRPLPGEVLTLPMQIEETTGDQS